MVRSTSGTAGPSPSPVRTTSQVENATRAIEMSRWPPTIAGCRSTSTVMPPMTAWSSTPTTGTRPSRRYDQGRRRSRTTSTATTVATATSRPLTVRLPNSMKGWIDVASWNRGVNSPGSHSGQVEHPRPEPVSRTAPPVTMMRIWPTRLATTAVQVHRSRNRSRVDGSVARAGDELTTTSLRSGLSPPDRPAGEARHSAPGQRPSSAATALVSASGTDGSRPSPARRSSRRG